MGRMGGLSHSRYVVTTLDRRHGRRHHRSGWCQHSTFKLAQALQCSAAAGATAGAAAGRAALL